MGLIRRLSRLLAADMHEVVDFLEEPEAVVRQSIREMQEILEDERVVEQQLAKELQRYSAELQSKLQELGALDEKLSLAFEEEREDLARSIVERKLRNEKERGQLDQQIRATGERHAALVEQQTARLEKLRELEQRLATAMRGEQIHQHGAASLKAEDIELALLQERRRWQNQRSANSETITEVA